jgi:hypothetical protein
VDTETIRIGSVPVQVVAKLRHFAEVRGQSLEAYLRDFLSAEASMPSIEEVMARITSREPINYTVEELQEHIEEGRA